MAINNVFVSVSGDCQQVGLGAFSLTIDGDAPDYTIVNITPSASTIPLGPYETGYTATNLTAGTYTLFVQDSQLPINATYLLSVNISSGTCVSITDTQGTTCNFSNGSLTAETQFQYSSPITFNLFDVNDNLINSITTPYNYVSFYGLQSGFYYVESDDGGGCSGRSEVALVDSSTPLTFSLYVIDNSSCNFNLGKIYVSGLTGTPPYTYQWSNGVTGTTFITGLTSGGYSLTITDSSGCQTTNSAVVGDASTLSVIGVVSNNPTCSGSDGDFTIYVSGGTTPYFFSASNGTTIFTYTPQVTLSNLTDGVYDIIITDAGLCQVNTTVTLLPTAGFSVQSINILNSNCNGFGGEIQVNIVGGPSNYTYQLVDQFGNTYSQTIPNLSVILDNLISGTYTLTISSSTSPCIFTDNLTISNTAPFSITATTTGTTCNQKNGSIKVEISDTRFYLFKLNGQLTPPSVPLVNGAIFNGLSPGNYTIEVIDSDACSVVVIDSISASQSVNFYTTINLNEISISIFQGTPPYSITWFTDDAVVGSDVTTISNLPPNTYYVSVTDANGCIKISKAIKISGTTQQGNIKTYNICSNTFQQSGSQTQGLSQMFFDGYVSLIENETNCQLTGATFTTSVDVNGTIYTNVFYTSTGITDIPTDNLWLDSVRNILLGIYGIGSVDINFLGNQIVINTDCTLPDNLLAGASILVQLVIDYEITCEYCTFLFEPCTPSTLPNIQVGIIPSNFNVGDIIVYSNWCYRYVSGGTESPIVLKDAPDYLAGNCATCLSDL